MYKQAYDFLVAIAEPVARPEFVHEYKLTPYSLYAAVAVAIATASILAVLDRLSKNRLPDRVARFLRDRTLRYGKAKLVLKRNRYYVESAHAAALKELLGKVAQVKQAALAMDYPPMEECDFRRDAHNPALPVDLKPTTKIRVYREKSLSKMFGNGRARSGIIVLPCGAGKTLTGVAAASTVRKSTLVLTTSAVSVEQWRQQFKLWCDIDDKHTCQFTADKKEEMHPKVGILCTTYNMIAFGGKRSHQSQRVIEQIRKREWGLMILAKMFRRVIETCSAHAKLGLTATLVREDDLIGDLNFLIGPKLYDANWMDLTQSGFLANVQCIEVWCPMALAFYREYLRADRANLQQLLYCANPTKFRTAEFLKAHHEQRGDKINIHCLLRQCMYPENVLRASRYTLHLWGNNRKGAAGAAGRLPGGPFGELHRPQQGGRRGHRHPGRQRHHTGLLALRGAAPGGAAAGAHPPAEAEPGGGRRV
ncbi:unnamed protein product [Heterosigma akashiwo]